MKFDNNGKVRTDAYVGTFATDDAAGMLEVESIKTFVKNMNKELKYLDARDKRNMPIRFRTTLKARKPINKIRHFRTGQLRGYSYHGDVLGGMANAGAVDVYIHRNLTDAMWKQRVMA
tara:strand:- start:46748 stop:47101 length:354 start_codon:yes stop_codon:yes gene_type:complete